MTNKIQHPFSSLPNSERKSSHFHINLLCLNIILLVIYKMRISFNYTEIKRIAESIAQIPNQQPEKCFAKDDVPSSAENDTQSFTENAVDTSTEGVVHGSIGSNAHSFTDAY